MTTSSRAKTLIATAQRHPELAQRLSQCLPPAERAEFVAALAAPAAPKPGTERVVNRGPRIGSSPSKRPTALSLQLGLFAKSVARIA